MSDEKPFNPWKLGEYYFRYSTRSWYQVRALGAVFVEDEDVPPHVKSSFELAYVPIKKVN